MRLKSAVRGCHLDSLVFAEINEEMMLLEELSVSPSQHPPAAEPQSQLFRAGQADRLLRVRLQGSSGIAYVVLTLVPAEGNTCYMYLSVELSLWSSMSSVVLIRAKDNCSLQGSRIKCF